MTKLRSYTWLNLLALMIAPTLANAAGTYYTGTAYQPAQSRYGQSGTYATSGYGRAVTTPVQAQNVRYSTYQTPQNTRTQMATQPAQQKKQSSSSKIGFFLDAGLTHESAMWQFDMKSAGSILSYDNVAWNVLDLTGGYIFDLGNTKMQIDAGFKYGMQWGKSTMIDDDITNGGYSAAIYPVVESGDTIKIIGHTLSTGTSKDGSMIGFNAGLGLTDFMKFGNLRITPSIGYRYFKYKLKTIDNYALEVDTSNLAGGCYESLGQDVCDPVYMFYNIGDNSVPAIVVANESGHVPVPTNYYYVSTYGTSYVMQPGTSHSYEVEWSGPYIAFDMLYDINQNNVVNGRIELGFPGYTSSGDQPYRWDWAHPKSVEDKASMFSAFHLGLAANWKTAISDSVAFTLGITYDYYTVSGADAKTYLNQSLYQQLENKDDTSSLTEIEAWQKSNLENNYNECGGWTCSANKEVDSLYKSMGIRAGIEARF